MAGSVFDSPLFSRLFPTGEAGRCYYYLITGYNGMGEGPAGNATAGPRVVDPTGACP